MNTRRLWMTIASVLFALFVTGPRSRGVWAQFTYQQASCPTGWEWNRNSLGQDPCEVASLMECACRSIGLYTISPLTTSENYAPPNKSIKNDLVCECNTVMYSLYMACSSCQGGMLLSWLGWITQCSTVSVAHYPNDIPFGSAVPRWAYYNITTLTNQTYNDTVAMSIGRDPEAKHGSDDINTSSASSSVHSIISKSSSRSAPYPTQTSTGSSNIDNTGIIVGGVVGGVVPLIILAVIVVLCLQRPRRARASHVKDGSEYYREHPTSPALTATSSNFPYNAHHSTYGPPGPGQYPGMPET